ncbi:hypothetical protein A6D98_13810 [Aliivibrio fischeri]|uniref:hypothetical protein n=2 Tax=Aliivibrio fischeri TaxID=668 RepID=UPI00080E12DD|nr:hypothetical protein [Aliivibrio fischeri]OCH06264.1 hypothetical protein A6E10_09365 [Aliivibrio fischeri]OCH24648.1 hypothetical protein A6E12_16645 [Aliivibrio fischeri]OCH59444.1 hypothetical protein A6D98_13810 [Aliivibrio fischeri]
MYNLNANEILMVDGGGDGNRPSSSRNPNNGHTTYGGQGGGKVGTNNNANSLGTGCGAAVATNAIAVGAAALSRNGAAFGASISQGAVSIGAACRTN